MLYRRGNLWWVQFKRGGRRYRLSTGETDSRRARIEAARLQSADYETPGPRRSGRPPSLKDLAGADIAEAEDRDLSPGQVGALRTIWRSLLTHFGAKATILDVKHSALIRYEGERRRNGIRGQTIRKEIAALKRGFKRAKRDGYRGDEPEWTRVRSDPPHPSRTGRFVERETLFAFLNALPGDLRAELLVCAMTGLRDGELHRLERSWITHDALGYSIRVPAEAAKTRHERIIALPIPALKILRAIPIASGPLFPRERWQRRYHLRKAAKAVGLPGPVTMRDLRTTYATTALAVTGDAQAVQAALGHSDLKTTQRYQRTTLKRTHAVGSAVAKSLAGPQPPGPQSPRRRRKSGRRGEI